MKPKTYLTDDTQRALVKPAKLVVGNHETLKKLKWTTWGAKKARARGISVANSCIPNCAEGKNLRYRIRLVAHGRGECGQRRQYRKVLIRYYRGGRVFYRGKYAPPCG